jgi:hypothetical protein
VLLKPEAVKACVPIAECYLAHHVIARNTRG